MWWYHAAHVQVDALRARKVVREVYRRRCVREHSAAARGQSGYSDVEAPTFTNDATFRIRLESKFRCLQVIEAKPLFRKTCCEFRYNIYIGRITNHSTGVIEQILLSHNRHSYCFLSE